MGDTKYMGSLSKGWVLYTESRVRNNRILEGSRWRLTPDRIAKDHEVVGPLSLWRSR